VTETPAETGVVGWVDVAALVEAEDWAATLDEDELREKLAAAYEQCLEFGPLLPGRRRWTPDHDGAVPVRFALAQKLQARALARSTSAGSGNQTGYDDMAVTVFPMDWTVKNLLRPRRAVRYPR